MRLLIISDMAHYLRDGVVYGHGPTARELSTLDQLFDDIRHVGCLHPGDPPDLMLPYDSDRVTLVPLPPSGGTRLIDKLGILRYSPLYMRTMLRELPYADVVHVRAPANIPLLACLLLAFVVKPKKRWIKYAGDWKPARSAVTWRFLRWWLTRNFACSLVTINGRYDDQPAHVHSFVNPCLTREELQEAEHLAPSRMLEGTTRLLFVGALKPFKGMEQCLDITARLVSANCDVHLDVVGDGSQRPELEAKAAALGITERVTFHGWMPRTALGSVYAAAHILLLPSKSEGWPKVLSEAMAYGVVPLASHVSSIPMYLRQFETGQTFAPEDVESFTRAILGYISTPERWKRESINGMKNAALFSYDAYVDAVKRLLELG